jgi:lambda family phage tail tape measure protein
MTGSLFDAEFGGAFDMQGYDAATGGTTTKPPAAAKAAATKKAGGYTKGPESAKGFAQATEAVRQQTEEIMRQVSVMIKREEMQTKFLNMSAREREIAIEKLRIEEDRDKLIANAEKEIALEEKKDKINRDRIKALQDQIEVIKYGKQVELEAIETIIRTRQEEQMTFSAGWDRAFKQFAETAQDASKLGEKAFTTFTDAMDAALSEFVKTGKLNFKNFALSIIQQLLLIQMNNPVLLAQQAILEVQIKLE